MMNKQVKIYGVTCAFLLLLSGCSCDKGKKSVETPQEVSIDAEVLVTKDGQPILTVKEFQEFMQEAIGADPQMQLMAQFMPDFEEQIFERAQLSKLVLEAWEIKSNIKEDAEYKKLIDQARKAYEMMVTQKMFIKKHVSDVTDKEAQNYYDENKTKDPNLMMAPEGVEAKGLSFEKEADAQKFFNKLNELQGNIEQAAKDVKKEVEDLGLVSQMSMIDPTVKERLLDAKKVPAVLPVIKAGDKEFWVVKAIKKQKAQYIPFDQIKDRIKESLMSKKIEEVFEKQIPEYQKQYNIVVNRSYFENKKKEREEQQAKMMQAMKEAKEKEQKEPATQEQSKELVQAKSMQKTA
ncbi:TPA: hypothetical protein DIC20_00430 [Candidatus Dependentiae bacterium]|nr:MAG: hypothetical protein US03_C0002G0063 [candidate division TM6 bacterium GW2011_GWF2_36_131]KKQ03497.1 MAG: hypothetical protein US13_C0002G0063 [candidate division TM6 bacterium GW2011_GWE2_36_25]KKQ20229.1 MAG: hypothetical protein US32_C0001G0126 [candidate division TM6 bacterium GW2011_GWA2_36_9]HBR70768.1 hypothetical protein [Candidatus Dependentiae bacterium]HCU00153.1 hypothetical protein [Candidatus Dependentiae bacterium]